MLPTDRLWSLLYSSLSGPVTRRKSFWSTLPLSPVPKRSARYDDHLSTLMDRAPSDLAMSLWANVSRLCWRSGADNDTYHPDHRALQSFGPGPLPHHGSTSDDRDRCADPRPNH